MPETTGYRPGAELEEKMLLVRTYLSPSPIHGIGVFASDPIKKDQPVWRFVPGFDQLLPPSYVHAGDIRWIETYTDTCTVTGMLMLCADNMRLMNHSCTPNICISKPLFHVGMTNIAIRNITAGEELTCDYRDVDKYPFKGFTENSLTDHALAFELRKIAEHMRYELLQIGPDREPDILYEAADRLERR